MIVLNKSPCTINSGAYYLVRSMFKVLLFKIKTGMIIYGMLISI